MSTLHMRHSPTRWGRKAGHQTDVEAFPCAKRTQSSTLNSGDCPTSPIFSSCCSCVSVIVARKNKKANISSRQSPFERFSINEEGSYGFISGTNASMSSSGKAYDPVWLSSFSLRSWWRAPSSLSRSLTSLHSRDGAPLYPIVFHK